MASRGCCSLVFLPSIGDKIKTHRHWYNDPTHNNQGKPWPVYCDYIFSRGRGPLMHSWGGDFKYFDDVDKAADYIGRFCRRWGRIGVTTTKEKFGTVRVYCSLGWGWNPIYGALKPGYVWYSWPTWFMGFEFWLTKWFGWTYRDIVCWWHKKVYRQAYQRALKKWPHIRNEILASPDFRDLLVGL